MKWLFLIGSKPFFSCFITGKLLSRNTDAVFSAIADGTFVYCVFKLNKFIYCEQLQSFLVISHNSNPPLWLFVTAIIPPCRRYNQYKTNCKGKRNENNYKQAFCRKSGCFEIAARSVAVQACREDAASGKHYVEKHIFEDRAWRRQFKGFGPYSAETDI